MPVPAFSTPESAPVTVTVWLPRSSRELPTPVLITVPSVPHMKALP
jgi:hypothetical protein